LIVNPRPGFTASYALHGLGGVGKTQIAIEYAYRHKSEFDIICWLRANDWNTLINSYVELSRIPQLTSLGIPSPQEGQDHVDIAKQMKDWFEKENNVRWLLIFDNADKIDQGENTRSVVELVPSGQYGFVLATSRDRTSDAQLASAGQSVEAMHPEEAVEFLLKCSRRQELEPAKDLVLKL